MGGGFAAVFDGYFGVGHHGYFADAAGFQRGGGDCPVAQRLGGRRGHSRLLRPNGRLRGHEFPRQPLVGAVEPGFGYQYAANAQYREESESLAAADYRLRHFRPAGDAGLPNAEYPLGRGHGHERPGRTGRHVGRDGRRAFGVAGHRPAAFRAARTFDLADCHPHAPHRLD